jgi:hypothetical protein
MLVGNGMRFGGQPMRTMGGASAGSQERARWLLSGALRNFYAGEASVSATSAIPNGHLHPSAWILPTKPGGMATYTSTYGTGDVTYGNLAGGLNAEADLTGSGGISTAAIAWIIVATAALAGAGTITAGITGKLEAVAGLTGSANVSGTLNAVVDIAATIAANGDLAASLAGALEAAAGLAGSGDLIGAVSALGAITADLTGGGGASGDMLATWPMQAGLTGSGAVSASLVSLGNIVAAITASGAVTAAATAKGALNADISSSGDVLDTSNVAQAVWGALASAFADAGTMGELLNTAGAGGLSPDQVAMLRELWQRAGLDATAPLTATASRIYVGDSGSPEIDLAVTGNGVTSSTVTRAP